MKKKDFFNELSEYIELDDKINDEDTAINLSSIQKLMVIAFFDEHFGMKIVAKDLNEVQTAKNLIQLAGNKNIE